MKETFGKALGRAMPSAAPERHPLTIFSDQQGVTVQAAARGALPRARQFAWASINHVFFSGRDQGTADRIYLFLDADETPLILEQDTIGLESFLHDLNARGNAPRPLTEIVLWSAHGKVTTEAHPFEMPADEMEQLPESGIHALVYPASAAWATQLAAAVPSDIHLAHIRRASTVAIYLQMRAISLAFVDTLTNDALLQQIQDISRMNKRDVVVVGIDSARNGPRSSALLQADWVRRVVQLPIRRRVLEGVISAAVGDARPRPRPLLPPVMLVTPNLLLAERLRDELESYREVVTTSDLSSTIAAVRIHPIAALLVDIEVSDEVLSGIVEMRARNDLCFRIFGVRHRDDMYRASQLLARGWVQRIVDAAFDPESLLKLGLIPRP